VRLGENITDPNSVYNNLNRVFDLLPLAAVVEDKILCVHSGVGAMKSLAELEAIERPTTVQKHKAVVDVLWSSTYADTRDVMGYNPSKSSESAINTFLETNNLMMVVRSRECVPEGYESDGNKINIFSVSNYGKAGGSAAILKITKNLDVVPFVLQANNNMRSPWIN
jgi:protein phosphatase